MARTATRSACSDTLGELGEFERLLLIHEHAIRSLERVLPVAMELSRCCREEQATPPAAESVPAVRAPMLSGAAPVVTVLHMH